MTIVVTGAGGFVCSELVLALARAGAEPIAVDRAFDPPTAARLTGISCAAGPIPDAFQNLTDLRPETVVHGAALTTGPEGLGLSRAAHLASNVALLTSTLAWARAAGARRFVFLSSMGLYAQLFDSPHGDRLTEQEAPTGQAPYSIAKRTGEMIAAAAADPEFQTASLRLGNIFGPHEARRDSRQHPCLVTRMREAAEATGTIRVETPEARREWAWLPDLAAGIAATVTQPQPVSGLYHAGTPPTLTDLDLARRIAARMNGVRIDIAPKPHRPVRTPMGSIRQSPLQTLDWTPIETGLDLLMPAPACPAAP